MQVGTFAGRAAGRDKIIDCSFLFDKEVDPIIVSFKAGAGAISVQSSVLQIHKGFLMIS